MTGFHFCFDLVQFRHLQADFYRDPFWTWQRSCILSLFLLCAGLGQAVAAQDGQGWPRFWRRWAQIAGCALLVSAASYLMFPRSFIHFGVLHGLTVMLLIARLTAGWGGWLWLAGAAVLLLHRLLPPWLDALGLAEIFNGRALNWLGLVTRKPITEDYVPLLPWMAVLWWGMALGHALRARRAAIARWTSPAPWLAWLGRWSLSWYMLHQPVLIGALWLVQRMQPT